jgi:hypothetical protein
MSKGDRWIASGCRPRFSGPALKEPETDGEVFNTRRSVRRVRAKLYEMGRQIGLRGRQLTKYVERNEPDYLS